MNEQWESQEVWNHYSEDIEKRKKSYYRVAADLIPSDVKSILDIGCGEGSFLNTLQDSYSLVGVDISRTALKHLEKQKIQSNIGSLPFKSKNFDLVSSLEVLEHLTQDTFANAVSEIKRVANKYVILSVPNEEPLEYFLVVCTMCNCYFNSVGHVRSFNYDTLEKLLLPEFKLKVFKTAGNTVEYPTYNKALFGALRSHVKPKPPKNAKCPQCGYIMDKEEKEISYSRLPASLRILKKIADTIWKPKIKKYYLVALYERQ